MRTNSRGLEAFWQLLLEYVPNNECGIVAREFWETVSATSLDYRERDAYLEQLNQQHRIDIFPQGEGERPMIAVRPARVFCRDCRQWHSGYEDWDDHFDACRKQQEKLRERGLLYHWKVSEPKGGRHV